MNNNEVIMKLVEELSITRLAMGQAICNYERRSGYVALETIARRWIIQSSKMPRNEWAAGTSALVHLLRLSNSKGAQDAIDLLESPDKLLEKNYRKYHGLFWIRGRKTAETYQQAVHNLRQEILPCPATAWDQSPRCDNGGIFESRRFVAQWKSKFSGVAKWLRNPD